MTKYSISNLLKIPERCFQILTFELVGLLVSKNTLVLHERNLVKTEFVEKRIWRKRNLQYGDCVLFVILQTAYSTVCIRHTLIYQYEVNFNQQITLTIWKHIDTFCIASSES